MKFDCQPIDGVELLGKILVIRPGALASNYDTFDNYFWKANGGFGCSPTVRGSAIITTNMFHLDDRQRWERQDLAGWLTDEEFEAILLEHQQLFSYLTPERK